MREIDLYFFYWAGVEAHLAANGLALNPPSLVAISLGKDALERFAASYDENFLPESKQRAKEIVVALDSIIPFLRQNDQPVLNPEDVAKFHALVVDFEERLQKECKHLYVLCVEDQRLFSAFVLVEQIEKAVAPKTWRYMSRLARREIAESGKCLAVERYTASGFHVLRCVECVIREYVIAVTKAEPTKRDWGYYCEVLKQNVAANEVVSIVDNMRRDDRNPLMHPEKYLNMDDAIGLFFLCQTALDRLISDMEKRGLAKEFTK